MGDNHPFDPWPAATVTTVADILADTDNGLSGREIGLLLERIGIADADEPNKRERLAQELPCQLAGGKPGTDRSGPRLPHRGIHVIEASRRR
ncbi:hypothetical protein ACWDBC_11130 [Streptomyces parvus]